MGECLLVVYVEDDGKSAAWMCYRVNCEWFGGIGMDGCMCVFKGVDGVILNRCVVKFKLLVLEDL